MSVNPNFQQQEYHKLVHNLWHFEYITANLQSSRPSVGQKDIQVVSEVPNLIHPQADKRETAWCGVGWISALQNTNAELYSWARLASLRSIQAQGSTLRDPTGGLGTLAAHILGTVLNGDGR